MTTTVEVLYDDAVGTDLLIGGRHNVNIGWDSECLSEHTHTARDGSKMQVQYHASHRTYWVLVAKLPTFHVGGE